MKRASVDAAGNYLGILNSAYHNAALSFGNLVKKFEKGWVFIVSAQECFQFRQSLLYKLFIFPRFIALEFISLT